MKNSDSANGKARIFYARVDEFWRKGEKYTYLEEKQHVGNVEWQEVQPDAKHNWLTEGMQDDYETFIPIGNKETKDSSAENAVFSNYSRGVETTRDAWLYNFNCEVLSINVNLFIDSYNEQVFKWQKQKRKSSEVDAFVSYDNAKLKWSSRLKQNLASGVTVAFNQENIRRALYRPYSHQQIYFDQILVHRRGQFPSILPTPRTEGENLVLCISDIGFRSPYSILITNALPDLHLCAPSDAFQCFPFYTYNEDGTNRRENITDWALGKFREHYKDSSITKWDIFHYVYALLHHPVYRERYAANLKRELPRIPFAPDFRAFAEAGARLAEIHVHYEQQPEYPLERQEQEGVPLNWRVEKMRLSKDKRSLHYNEFLTLSGIPPAAFEYRLGNRSALEWVIDQYSITTDRRSGITNDPNRADDPSYIVRLVAQVITVSLETVEIVRSLPRLV
jgi:predicted helicase